MNCKNCKYKNAEFYIGRCKKIGCIKMMNDTCGLHEEKTGGDTERAIGESE